MDTKIESSKANRSILDNKALQSKKEVLLKIVDIIDDVISGTDSMTNSCRHHNLDYAAVRRVLMLKVFQECEEGVELVDLSDSELLEPDGYEKIYIDVFDKIEISHMELPIDYKKSIQWVMKKMSNREATVIDLLYGLTMPSTSVTGIAKMFGVTNARVTQIKGKGLAQFKFYRNVLAKGITKYEADKKIEESRLESYDESVRSWVNESLKSIDDEKESSGKVDLSTFDINVIFIEDIGLSPRVMHRLKDTGINTLKDLSEKSDNWLRGIYGFGDTAVQEVHDKADKILNRLGIFRPNM